MSTKTLSPEKKSAPSETLAKLAGGPVKSWEELVAGTPTAKDTGVTSPDVLDKDKLIGVPFVVLDWAENQSSQYEGSFLSIAIVVPEPIVPGDDTRLYLINDGSPYGVMGQLQKAASVNGHKRLYANSGLKVDRLEATANRPAGKIHKIA